MSDIKNHSSISWIAHMSNKVKMGGGINLAQGIPGFDPPSELLGILRDMSLKPVHQYPAGNGHPELVEQICQSYSAEKPLTPDEVLVVQGATEGVSLVYTYLNHKFGNNWGALAFDPVYESYNELPKIFGNDLFKMPFEKGGSINRPEAEIIARSKEIKLVFVNSPGNPFGKIWTRDEFEWLFSLAHKYDFYLLLDAVYKDLYFGESAPYLPPGYTRERLFYINSFSKMLSITGWRVGYLITEADMMKEIRAIHDYTGLCAPSILQYAISDYLGSCSYGRKYLQEIRRKLSDNYRFMKDELIRLDFYVEAAGGGYFIWCRLPEKCGSGVEFSLELYDNQKVGVVPGVHFSKDAEKWIRINIAREKEDLVEARQRIEMFLNAYNSGF